MPTQAVPTIRVDTVEFFVELLAEMDATASTDDFYSRLCEATCRLGEMDRAVIFRYDERIRRVRPAGAYGIDPALFSAAELSIDSAPIARRALEQGTVIDVSDAADRELPAGYRHLLRDATLVCTPIAAAGRWSGVIISDRAPRRPLTSEERDVLWTLGKSAALATFAWIATQQAARARQLEDRINLAREIHEGVVQRLFGVLLALSSGRDLSPEIRDRCASELQAGLGDLRQALQRPLRRRSTRRTGRLADEIERLCSQHPDIGVRMKSVREIHSMPKRFNALAHSIVNEAVRNASKHAKPSYVEISAASVGDIWTLEIVNDGVADPQQKLTGGVGLRLAAIEALQLGGLLEFGPACNESWHVRLAAPKNGN